RSSAAQSALVQRFLKSYPLAPAGRRCEKCQTMPNDAVAGVSQPPVYQSERSPKVALARSSIVTASVLAAMALAGCGGVTPTSQQTDPTLTGTPFYGKSGNGAQYGSISEDNSLFTFGHGKNNQDGGGAGLGVNAYLWRGTLETLSFMPLASADP